MKIEHIREFLSLAETLDFSETADDLFLSQASLSRHMMALEEELGYKLFNRCTRKATLSEAGMKFLEHARSIVNIQDECMAKLREKAKEQNGTLTIGVSSIFTSYVSDILGRFIQAYPHIHIKIVEDRGRRLLELLRDKKADFIFIVRNSNDILDGLQSLQFYADLIVAILPETNALASTDKIHFSQLRNEHFILQPDGSPMHALCTEACRLQGFEPNVIYTCVTGPGIIEFVKEGNGVGFLMKQTALNLKKPGITLVDLEPEYHGYIDLCYYKTKSVTTNIFLQFIVTTQA